MGLLVNGYYVRLEAVNFFFNPGSAIEARIQLSSAPGVPLFVLLQLTEIIDRSSLYPQIKTTLQTHGFTVEDS